MQILFKIFSWSLAAFLIYYGMLFLMQRQLMFPRGLIGSPPPGTPDINGLEKLWLQTASGGTEAWYIPPAPRHATPAPVVIFAHGNAELIDFWPEEFNTFTEFGIGLLLVEYPGYGRSDGTPSQKSIAEVFIEAYDAVALRRDVDPSRIVLFGRSIGGGAVCALAAERPCAALMLMSSFTSARAMASKYFAPGFLVRDPFDNLSIIKAFKGPVLIIHGKRDDVIPFSHGVSLYTSADSATMVAYDCAHNDCPPDWDIFWQDVAMFLRKAGIIKR